MGIKQRQMYASAATGLQKRRWAVIFGSFGAAVDSFLEWPWAVFVCDTVSLFLCSMNDELYIYIFFVPKVAFRFL